MLSCPDEVLAVPSSQALLGAEAARFAPLPDTSCARRGGVLVADRVQALPRPATV
jgi:hypothetical protein